MGYLLINYKGVTMIVTFKVKDNRRLNKTEVFKNEDRAKWYLDNGTLELMNDNHYEYLVQSESQMNEAIMNINAYGKSIYESSIKDK